MQRSTGSHSLIGEREQTVLRRLSRFVGPFTLDAAEAVASDDGIDPAEVAEDLAQLAAKSLVVADTSEDKARYRLLETTRAYAHAKLDAAGEVDATARKHALYYAELLDLFKARNRKLGEFGAEHIANARAGLAWCFSAAGDAELAVRLANGSTRLFREFSLLGECWQWCDRALRILPEFMRDTYWELNLHASIGYCLMFTQGNSEQTCTAFEKGLTIAQALGDYFYQFRLLAGLHMYYRRRASSAGCLPSPGRRRPSLPRWRNRRRSSGPTSCSASPTILPATRPPPMPPCRHRWSTVRTPTAS